MEGGDLVKDHGMGVPMAAIFIAGQMAGGGVLMLPGALVKTGPWGLVLLAYFTINGAFVGTRLGHCWILVEELFPEIRAEKCRDPYPTIAEKAVGRIGRIFSQVCIMGVQYGTGVGFLTLMAKFVDNIFQLESITPCIWMVVMAAIVTPLCWFGSPHDFWFMAPTALGATACACIAIMVKESMDAVSEDSCYVPELNATLFGGEMFEEVGVSSKAHFEPNFPTDLDFLGFGEAFSLIMFAYSGSASFPTYQSDMKDVRMFPKSVFIAMTILFVLYVPMASVGYFQLGEIARDDGGIVCVLCDGGVKIAVEVLLLVHLISAYPMFLNPPNQFIEKMLGIQPTFNVKRTLFRTIVIAILLFLAFTLPSFSAILQLISSVFVTCLTFVFPAFFYMILMRKAEKAGHDRSLGWLEIVLCSQAILVGVFGGIVSFVASIQYIREAEFIPCFMDMKVGGGC